MPKALSLAFMPDTIWSKPIYSFSSLCALCHHQGRLLPSNFLYFVAVVQSLSSIWIFATPWTAVCQASLSSPRICSNSCTLLPMNIFPDHPRLAETHSSSKSFTVFYVFKVSRSVASDSLWPLWTVTSVHGILQARILEWVAILFSRGSSQLRDGTCVSCFGRRLYHLSYQGSSYVLKVTFK